MFLIIVNFEQISPIVLVFWLLTSNCQLGYVNTLDFKLFFVMSISNKEMMVAVFSD